MFINHQISMSMSMDRVLEVIDGIVIHLAALEA